MTTKTTDRALDTRQYPVVDPMSLPGEIRPLPDGMFQNPHFFYVVSTLHSRYADDPTVFVDGNTIVCYNPDNLNDRVFPDCYVAFDVDADAIMAQNGYLTWQVGKPPDFVLEIASVSTFRRDLTVKRDLYAAIGVPENWRFDSTGGDYYGQPLAGERLVDGSYEPIELSVNADGYLSGWSEVLGLYLCAGDDGRLRFYDPVAGCYLLDLTETRAARRESENARRESEAALSEERARVRELEEELRRLRGR